MDLELDGNAALCTAASSGLGLASANALAQEGADVAICGRTPEHVEQAEAELEEVGDGEVLAVEADLTDRAQVEALVDQTVDVFGGLDHLVMSAGGPPSGSFSDIDNEDWYKAFDTLVMSAVWSSRYAHPHLVESDAGSIVAITSRSVVEVIDDLVLSNAVRRAVFSLVETQAREFAPDIRVNTVLPNDIETARMEELISDAVECGEYNSYDKAVEEWSSGVPLGRMGKPEELGDVVAFLSSERASYVTGTALPIDGGVTGM